MLLQGSKGKDRTIRKITALIGYTFETYLSRSIETSGKLLYENTLVKYWTP